MTKIDVKARSVAAFSLLSMGIGAASGFDVTYPPGYWENGYCASAADWKQNFVGSKVPIFATCTPVNINKTRWILSYQIRSLPKLADDHDPYFWHLDLIDRYY